MNPPIDSFAGEYRFLSNFFPTPVFLDNKLYSSTEHAYQAAKTLIQAEREEIQRAGTPGLAKKLGRKVTLRVDWESIKINVMRELLRQKFARGTPLSLGLVATGDAILIEGNHWNDCFWGVCRGVGENHLGKLLMEQRSFLLSQGIRG